MGKLVCDSANMFEIDDRLLAHLRVVAMKKPCRGESFMMQLPGPTGGHPSIFVSPSMPLMIHFYGGRAPRLDPELLEARMRDASAPDGLTLSPGTAIGHGLR